MTSPFSNTDNPAMAAMSDPLNFVKNLWGGMHVPGMVTPTVSIDELDKKITDLKTVESWLNVNMTMLKGSIQALEVQRATISTLKAMGESFAEQMNQAKSGAAAASSDTKTSNQTWPMHAASAAPKAAAAPAASKPEASQPEAPKSSASAAASKPAPDASSTSGFGNPAAMWNLLQDQFKQAVSKVMEGEQAASAMAKAATAGVMGNAAAGNSGAQAPVTAAAKTSAKVAPKPAQKTTAGAASKAAPKAKAATKNTAKVAKPPAA
ncbi:PhaM family polyhydroxyalkanoate granule multifunctional regulatory protein [Undibacterium sp.]|uniref:PhaM family polyhydroxyalkanoate granule multifunctional regulatory protein n=1 Tax=Undibacterium sp. TaxID=1914977 RepID=UPI0025EEFA18|nr:PhaM family polyhydroxyalkanoate granule multifunctional regulatory protein [Undibacterium sp.]